MGITPGHRNYEPDQTPSANQKISTITHTHRGNTHSNNHTISSSSLDTTPTLQTHVPAATGVGDGPGESTKGGVSDAGL